MAAKAATQNRSAKSAGGANAKLKTIANDLSAHNKRKLKLEKFLTDDRHLFGPNSKCSKAKNLLADELKDTEEYAFGNPKNVAVIDHRWKNLAKVIKHAYFQFNELFKESYASLAGEEYNMRMFLGDLARYLAKCMDIPQKLHRNDRIERDTWARNALEIYCNLDLNMRDYDKRVRNLFKQRPYYALLFDMQKLYMQTEIAVMKKQQLNLDRLAFVSTAAAEVIDWARTLSGYDYEAVSELAMFVKSTCDLMVELVEEKSWDAINFAFRIPHGKIIKQWLKCKHATPEIADVMILIITMLARIFKLELGQVPLLMSVLLKQPILSKSVQRDFVADQPFDDESPRYPVLIEYSVQNTMETDDESKVPIVSLDHKVRILNANPAMI